MDRLARNAMLAKQSGLSYGQWKAMQPRVEVDPLAIPDGWKPCEYCGKGVKPMRGRRYCSTDCREAAYRERSWKG